MKLKSLLLKESYDYIDIHGNISEEDFIKKFSGNVSKYHGFRKPIYRGVSHYKGSNIKTWMAIDFPDNRPARDTPDWVDNNIEMIRKRDWHHIPSRKRAAFFTSYITYAYRYGTAVNVIFSKKNNAYYWPYDTGEYLEDDPLKYFKDAKKFTGKESAKEIIVSGLLEYFILDSEFYDRIKISGNNIEIK